MADEATFPGTFIQLLKHWLCDLWSDVAAGKNWAHFSVEQYQLQVEQFLVHLIDLLSILLRCNGFAGIQKALVDQTGSGSPNSDRDLFWCGFVWLWEVLWSTFPVQLLS